MTFTFLDPLLTSILHLIIYLLLPLILLGALAFVLRIILIIAISSQDSMFVHKYRTVILLTLILLTLIILGGFIVISQDVIQFIIYVGSNME
jgi:hypothetical protein